MFNHIVARRRVARVLAVLFAAVVAMVSGGDAWAGPTDDLPPPSDPSEAPLSEPGDRYAVFNDAVIACYNGSMGACDSILQGNRVLMDSFLGKYARTCGGRVDLRTAAGDLCTEIFPGHE